MKISIKAFLESPILFIPPKKALRVLRLSHPKSRSFFHIPHGFHKGLFKIIFQIFQGLNFDPRNAWNILPLDRALLLLESERDLFRYPCSCPTDMAELEVESMPAAWSVMEDSATDPESLRCREGLELAWLELLSNDSPIRRVDCSEYSELSTSVNRSRWPLKSINLSILQFETKYFWK